VLPFAGRMLTIIISAVLAVGLFVGGLLAFDVISAVVAGLLGGVGAFILLLRRGRKGIEGGMKEIEAHMKNQRFEKALSSLEALRPLARWQPGLQGSLEAQIGMIRYAHMREFEGARPHLERAHRKVWQAWAMLGAAHFKKERWDDMRAVFERAVRANKKEALLWLIYAYCDWRRGARAEAIAVLVRAQKECPSDERIKTQLAGLQNGKKLKMPAHDPEWLALHLERTMATGAQAKPRFMPPARRIGVRHPRG
jgi:tetratricopeptide (TPR) repeat protein